MGIDRLLDIMSTAANVNGDDVLHMTKKISMDVFNDPDAGIL